MRTLYNGTQIPSLGFGTPITLKYWYKGEWNAYDVLKYWMHNLIKDGKQLRVDVKIKQIMSQLPKNILIDTSRAYAGSESIIGKEVRRRNRDDFFIATKLCNKDQYAQDIRGAFEKSLKALGVDYVDCYLIHWPVPEHWINSWKELERIYEEGLCKTIGVCNCNIHHLEELEVRANVKPMLNQFECHPLFTQEKLREYCRDNQIQVMAYTATGRMDDRLQNTVLSEISKKYEKSIAQVIIRWHMQIGNIPIVSTTNAKHLKDNFNVFDFRLTEEEVQKISNCNINSRLRYDPDNCNFSRL